MHNRKWQYNCKTSGRQTKENDRFLESKGPKVSDRYPSMILYCKFLHLLNIIFHLIWTKACIKIRCYIHLKAFRTNIQSTDFSDLIKACLSLLHHVGCMLVGSILIDRCVLIAEIYKIVSQKQIRDSPDDENLPSGPVTTIKVAPTDNGGDIRRKQCCNP